MNTRMSMWNIYLSCVDNSQKRGCFPKLYDQTYFDYKDSLLDGNIKTIISEQIFFWKNNLQDNTELKDKIKSHMSLCSSNPELPKDFKDENGNVYVSEIFKFILN